MLKSLFSLFIEIFLWLASTLDVFLFIEWHRYNHSLYHQYASQCLLIASGMLLCIPAGIILVRLLRAGAVSGPQGRRPACQRCEVRHPNGMLSSVEYFGEPKGADLIFIKGINSEQLRGFLNGRFLNQDLRPVLIRLPYSFKGSSTREFNSRIVSDLRYLLSRLRLHNAALYRACVADMIITEEPGRLQF